jgi:hypothetical protein
MIEAAGRRWQRGTRETGNALPDTRRTWMPNFLSVLTKIEQTRLLEELNYMNLEEIRGFCSERGIPYRSWPCTRPGR